MAISATTGIEKTHRENMIAAMTVRKSSFRQSRMLLPMEGSCVERIRFSEGVMISVNTPAEKLTMMIIDADSTKLLFMDNLPLYERYAVGGKI